MNRVFVLQYQRERLSTDAYVGDSAAEAAKLMILKEFTLSGERKPSDSVHGEDYENFLEHFTAGYKPDRDHYPSVFSDIIFHPELCFEFVQWYYNVFLHDEEETKIEGFWAWSE